MSSTKSNSNTPSTSTVIKPPVAHNYEILFIVSAQVKKPEAVAEQIKDLLPADAKAKQTALGQKEFAQPIKKQTSGFYFLIHASLLGATINDLRQKMFRFSNVLRFLIVNLDEEKRFRFRGPKPEPKKTEKSEKKPVKTTKEEQIKEKPTKTESTKSKTTKQTIATKPKPIKSQIAK